MNQYDVTLSEQTRQFIAAIKEDIPDELVMFIGSGCCDGPVPQLFKQSETIIPTEHEVIYQDESVTVYFIAPMKYEPKLAYTIDLKTNVLNDSFSLESRYDCQFVLQT